MSTIFSGDRAGHNWTCSVVSEFIDEEKLKYMEKIEKILQMFICQQYSGRVLKFFLLLGYLCKNFQRVSQITEAKASMEQELIRVDPSILMWL